MTIDSDPGLNSMLLDGVTQKLLSASAEFRKMYAEKTVSIEDDIKAAVQVVLAMYPEILEISWTFSSGEYNDSTYDGFSISDYYVKWDPAANLKLGDVIDIQDKSTWYGEHENDPVDTEWDDWYGNKADKYQFAEAALGACTEAIQSFNMYFSDLYGSNMRYIINRSELYTEIRD